MKAFYTIDLVLQVAADALGHDRDPVFVPFCTENVYFAAFQIDVLDPEPDAFHQPQAGSVKNSRHQKMVALHFVKDMLDFLLGQYHRKPGSPFGPFELYLPFDRNVEHSFVKEHDRIEGLPLGGSGHFLFTCQVAEKTFDFEFTHVFWMSFCSVKPDIAQNPVRIGLLGPVGIMVISEDLLYLIHQAETWIWPEFKGLFHVNIAYHCYVENKRQYLPLIELNIC